jgi:hypothetical protein
MEQKDNRNKTPSEREFLMELLGMHAEEWREFPVSDKIWASFNGNA